MRSRFSVASCAIWAGPLMLIATFGLCPSVPAQTQTQTAPKPKPSVDAIHARMQAFSKAFDTADPSAVVGHWASEGEFVTAHGLTVHGHPALQDTFAQIFKKLPHARMVIDRDQTRFLSGGAAIEEGIIRVRSDASSSSLDARYKAILVQEGPNWLIARLEESPLGGPELNDLNWLVGEWTSGGQDQAADIRITYAWDTNKKFLNARFTVKEKDRAISGHQVIGIDPADGQIHTWSFEGNGGVGEASWTRDGDHWVLELIGTLPDGGTLIEKNILRRVNDNTFTIQSVDRSLDDKSISDMPPVKVTRVKPQG